MTDTPPSPWRVPCQWCGTVYVGTCPNPNCPEKTEDTDPERMQQCEAFGEDDTDSPARTTHYHLDGRLDRVEQATRDDKRAAFIVGVIVGAACVIIGGLLPGLIW